MAERVYRGVVVRSGSALATALAKSEKEGRKVFDDTTRRYGQLYPAADRAWFAAHSNKIGTPPCET